MKEEPIAVHVVSVWPVTKSECADYGVAHWILVEEAELTLSSNTEKFKRRGKTWRGISVELKIFSEHKPRVSFLLLFLGSNKHQHPLGQS